MDTTLGIDPNRVSLVGKSGEVQIVVDGCKLVLVVSLVGTVNSRSIFGCSPDTVRFDGEIGRTVDGKRTLQFTYRPRGWSDGESLERADLTELVA